MRQAARAAPGHHPITPAAETGLQVLAPSTVHSRLILQMNTRATLQAVASQSYAWPAAGGCAMAAEPQSVAPGAATGAPR
jgi:hypothetical protein